MIGKVIGKDSTSRKIRGVFLFLNDGLLNDGL